MAKRGKRAARANPLELIRQLHEQLKQCPRLPPPWDAYQSDDPLRYHDLTRRLVDGLRIPGFGPARHLIHRGEPPAQAEFFPDRCWAITAMPSFHAWGLFAVFESRSLVRCAFVCKGNLPDRPDADYVVVDTFFEAADWSDPVMDLLARGPLAPTPDRSQPEGTLWATLDGIRYCMQVETADVSARLQLSNPRCGHYRALACAAHELAGRVARVVGHPQASSFVRAWAGYLRG